MGWNSFAFGFPRPAGRTAQTPESLEDLNMPETPTRAPGLRAPGGSPLPVPDMALLDPSRSATRVTAGGTFGRPGNSDWDMSGGTPQSTQSALAGLEKYEGDQFGLSLGEFELERLANRDPNMVMPGSNAVWQRKLDNLRMRETANQKNEMDIQHGLDKAIASAHPAAMHAQQQKAMADALPAMMNARGQMSAAQIAAGGRTQAANTVAGSRLYGDRMAHLDQVMQAISGFAKKTTRQPGDDVALRNLLRLYDDLASGLTGATFEQDEE